MKEAVAHSRVLPRALVKSCVCENQGTVFFFDHADRIDYLNHLYYYQVGGAVKSPLVPSAHCNSEDNGLRDRR